MEKQFVPYKEAQVLKELGFNENCFAAYLKNQKICYCKPTNWIKNFQEKVTHEVLQFQIDNYPDNVFLVNGEYKLEEAANFTAPLYQQAFTWFREKHEILFEFNYFPKNNNLKTDAIMWDYSILCKPYYKGNYIHGEEDGFYAKEEAELACLKKLIEIIKKKTN